MTPAPAFAAMAVLAADLTLSPLGGGPEARLSDRLAGRPAVVMFWRTDCAPCLVELRGLGKLRRAAGSTPLLLVGLQDEAALRTGLRRLRMAAPADSWRALDDPAETLVRFGGAPPRMPLAVMLDRSGAVCARRLGMVGPKLIEEWGAACGGR